MTYVEMKAGFNTAEARDASGRWSGGGGGGDIGGHVSNVANRVLVNPSPFRFHEWLHNLLQATPHVPSFAVVASVVAGRVLFRTALVGGLVYAGRQLARRQAHQDVAGVIAGGGRAPASSSQFIIRVGPDEPHAARGTKIGVYQDGKPVHPDEVPPQIRKVLGLKSPPAAETKTGFDPSQPRDEQGRWVEGAGGIFASTRLLGRTGEIVVNPDQYALHRMLVQSPEHGLHAIGVGDNVLVASSGVSHDLIARAVKENNHPLGEAAADAGGQRRYILDASPVATTQFAHEVGGFNVRVRDSLQRTVDPPTLPATLRHALGIQGSPPPAETTQPWDDPSFSGSLRRWLTGNDVPPPGYLPKWYRPPAPTIRSRTMRLRRSMHPETKFNFDPAQARDPSGKWTRGGPGLGAVGRIALRIGDRFGSQPLSPGQVAHPHGQIWVNPSAARLVAFSREKEGIGNVIRHGKNIIVARGDISADQAVDWVHANRLNFYQPPEPDLPKAQAQTKINDRPGTLRRKEAVFVNPSPRNIVSLFKKSKDQRVRTMVIGDNLVVSPGHVSHGDMQRILSRSGHPLGQQIHGSKSHIMRSETKAGFTASEARDEQGRWTGSGRTSGGPFRRRDRPIAPRVRGPHGQEIYAGSDVISAAMQGNRRAMAMAMPTSYHVARRGTLLVNPHPALLASVLEHFSKVDVKPKVEAAGDNLLVRFGKVSAKEVSAGGVRSIDESRIPDRPQALIQHEKGSIIVNPHPSDIAGMLHGTGGHIHLIRADGNIIVAGSNIPRDEVLSSVAAKGGRFRHIAEHAIKSADDLVEVEMTNLTDDATVLAELKNLLASVPNVTSAPCELKFIGDPDEGLIEGYASIYGVVDGHGDVVEPGAFDVSLKDFMANGKQILMYGEHSPYKQGGDPYPVGKWESVESDEKGLRVRGRLLALDHPDVKRVHTLIKAGALPGISIAYNVNPGGAEMGRKTGDPKRRLKSINLVSIDLTANPSNPLALIDGFKAISAMQSIVNNSPDPDGDDDLGSDPDEALGQVEDAMGDCQSMIDAEQPPDVEQLMGLMERLHDCHDALTGNAPHMVHMDMRDAADLPDGDGVKSITFTKRRLEKRLREELIAGKRMSQREARHFVDRVFDDEPRDEADEPEQKAEEAVASELAAALADFKLISGS